MTCDFAAAARLLQLSACPPVKLHADSTRVFLTKQAKFTTFGWTYLFFARASITVLILGVALDRARTGGGLHGKSIGGAWVV